MKTIGEFAKENNVTVKALHHYEKLGLLIPAKVNEVNKYRYYNQTQRLELEMILLLKDLGFSLSEISELVTSNDINAFKKFLEEKQFQTQIDISSSSRRYNKITSILRIIKNKAHSNLNYKELMSMSDNLSKEHDGYAKFQDLANEMVAKAYQNKTPLCAIQMDIDSFMAVNKDYGRDVGDIVIDRIASAILSAITKSNSNTIFERRGGDEYTVIVEADLETSVELAKTILNQVNNIDYLDINEILQPTITIGIAKLEEETKSFTYLIHEATSNLYEAKRLKNKNSIKY